MAQKKVVVDPDKCIGCNTCVLIDPDTFYLDNTDYKAKIKTQPQEITDKILLSISSCPVDAISLIDEV